ncbi:unnamed protein product [Pleuronectes platessa]|uniref:Uncharacterized protein n=1 Tax=Pleuronectes platessa TaxID=8262 RepID=A0A9N7U1G1_PLEPL|nr:unnamed protein product [Pleuronectes platessa]
MYIFINNGVDDKSHDPTLFHGIIIMLRNRNPQRRCVLAPGRRPSITIQSPNESERPGLWKKRDVITGFGAAELFSGWARVSCLTQLPPAAALSVVLKVPLAGSRGTSL